MTLDQELVAMTDKYAYERGLTDGRKGIGAGSNPYVEPDSRYYQYSVGYASGYAETHEEDAGDELSTYQEFIEFNNGPGTHAWNAYLASQQEAAWG